MFARQAADAFRAIGAAFCESNALALLSELYAGLGDDSAAAQASEVAAALRSELTGTTPSS